MKYNIPQNAVLSSASKDVFTDSLTQSVHWLWPIIILKATTESWLREDLKDYHILTPWRLGGFGDFHKKNSSFQLPYQRLSSSADCARELFNGSNRSPSLVDCTRKKIFAWGCGIFDPLERVILIWPYHRIEVLSILYHISKNERCNIFDFQDRAASIRLLQCIFHYVS